MTLTPTHFDDSLMLFWLGDWVQTWFRDALSLIRLQDKWDTGTTWHLFPW